LIKIDAHIPWFTPLYPYYLFWPFSFFIIIPFILWKTNKKRGVALYCTISIIMYIIGTYIYQIFPTTFTPLEFINGKYNTLSQSAPFYHTALKLASNTNNIWGAFPSYHNFWAALFIIIPLIDRREENKQNRNWRIASTIIGSLITISTLVLHQHAFLDVVFTYLLTLSIYFIVIRTSIVTKTAKWLFDTFL
ncbi:MAG: phosphatase PAP2 family protein, partial [Lactobacillales bacterium]|nr:phosphatase PAP2 family protein [Lactobacillales bacterium]